MVGWLSESVRRLCGSLAQPCGSSRGKRSQEETRQTQPDGRVSKPDWSELPSGVADQDVAASIVLSKTHWSELPEGDLGSEVLTEAAIQESNRTNWKALQKQSPFLFQDWSEKVRIGRQIAEGGQAKIYKATWKKDEYRRLQYMAAPEEMVVKVFKLNGLTLENFMRQWPRFTAKPHTKLKFPQGSEVVWSIPAYDVCPIVGAYLLKNDRFAFLMPRYQCDLRSLLQKRMRGIKRRGPPFPDHRDALELLHSIAKGMESLHGHGTLHRDLKASNVLVRRPGERICYYVSDYECSVSTVGTGFWRAPEVLQELRHPSGRSVDVWTTKSDVYSFSMTCVEVLTGGDPFPELSDKGDWGEIIDHHRRPHLPDYVDSKLKQLVERCWNPNPLERPSFREIVEELESQRRSLP